MKKIITIFMLIILLFSFTACSENIDIEKLSDDNNSSQDMTENILLLASDLFTENDKDTRYDESSSTSIVLNEETVNIAAGGSYIVSGELADGQIVVEVGEDNNVWLVLDNATINSNSSAAIYIKSAKNVYITLAENSNNTLSVSGEYSTDDENNVDAVIFSKTDISFNGNGTLNINANFGNGIEGKDDIVFASGSYIINAQNKGINANDSIRITGANFNITSGKDGMQCDNEDTGKGYIYVENGILNINSMQDCFDASGTLQLDDGTFELSSGGGFGGVLNTITVGEGAGNSVQATDQLEHSMKAIKGFDMTINGGQFSISSYEDAIHSNNNLVLNGGVFTINTGDDAVHADGNMIINYAEIDVIDGYEGIEASNITINDGDISVVVLDDAVNASPSTGLLTINGGRIYLESQGDGIDSNGSFTMTGGELVLNINAIHVGGDGNVDVTGVVTFTGGTIKDLDGNDIDPTETLGGRGGFGGMPGGMERPDNMGRPEREIPDGINKMR